MADYELNRNYEFLFEQPEDIPKKINKNIGRLMEMYPDIDVLKGIIKTRYGEEFFEDTYLNDLIGHLYSEEGKDIQYDIICAIKTLSGVKEIYVKPENSYRIETEKQTINISSIEQKLKQIMEKNNISQNVLNNALLQDYLSKVESERIRTSKCHELSIDLAKMLTNYFNINCNIVTGLPKYYVNQQKYLHSWVELEMDGESYVIDSTMNTALNKDGYYLLRHIDENELISSISGNDIVQDNRVYGEFLNKLDLKTYLTSRDEIINDLEKNKQLFEKSDEGEER